MQKNRLFTFLIFGAALIIATSCSKDEDDPLLGPSLTVNETVTGTNSGDIEISQGSSLVFAWETRKGDDHLETFSLSETGANPDNPIPETYDGHELPYNVSGDDRNNYVDTLALPNAGANLGTTSYTFSVVDESGLSTSVTFDVTVTEPLGSTELSDPLPFTWTREGGSDGTGLEQFGLKWTENTSTSAIVAIDDETVMVDLGSAAWTDLETVGDITAAITDGNPIETYQGVSVEEDGTYDDVLGVSHDGVNYLIHITQGEVSTGSAGTTVTISGDYKY